MNESAVFTQAVESQLDLPRPESMERWQIQNIYILMLIYRWLATWFVFPSFISVFSSVSVLRPVGTHADAPQPRVLKPAGDLHLSSLVSELLSYRLS